MCQLCTAMGKEDWRLTNIFNVFAVHGNFVPEKK